MEYKSGAVRPVESISEGWNIIKDSYWNFFLMTLVAIIIMVIASLILGGINNVITYAIAAALGSAAQNSGDAGKVSAAIIPQIISLVISVFTNIIVLTLVGAMYCGIYKALSRKADGGAADFGDLFAGFQKIMPCFVVSAVLSTVQFFIGIVTLLGGAAVGISALGSGILKDGKLNPAIFGGLFLVIIVFLVISLIINLIIAALTTFVYPLLAERELSGGQALLLSIKSGFANIGGIILLLILLGLMAFAGILLCFVGVLFVAPVLTAAIFAAFRSVFGKTNDFRQYSPPSPPSFGNQAQF